jgi:hypothetical protein
MIWFGTVVRVVNHRAGNWGQWWKQWFKWGHAHTTAYTTGKDTARGNFDNQKKTESSVSGKVEICYELLGAWDPGQLSIAANQCLVSTRDYQSSSGMTSHLTSGYQGIQWSGHEADHSPSSSAQDKNVWRYTSTPSYVFLSWCLIINHRDNFTRTLLLGAVTYCLAVYWWKNKLMLLRLPDQIGNSCLNNSK